MSFPIPEVSFLVGRAAVVELRQVLRVTLLLVFLAGMPIVPCDNSSDFPLVSLESLWASEETSDSFLVAD